MTRFAQSCAPVRDPGDGSTDIATVYLGDHGATEERNISLSKATRGRESWKVEEIRLRGSINQEQAMHYIKGNGQGYDSILAIPASRTGHL